MFKTGDEGIARQVMGECLKENACSDADIKNENGMFIVTAETGDKEAWTAAGIRIFTKAEGVLDSLDNKNRPDKEIER